MKDDEDNNKPLSTVNQRFTSDKHKRRKSAPAAWKKQSPFIKLGESETSQIETWKNIGE